MAIAIFFPWKSLKVSNAETDLAIKVSCCGSRGTARAVFAFSPAST